MIDKDKLKAIVEEWLQGGDYFLVDIVYTPDDRIVVEIDCAEGVWIDDCAELSRYVSDRMEGALDDYELEVGSAGIGQPFKVERQYECHIGKPVETLPAGGTKVQGTLTKVGGGQFTILAKEKQTIEGKKRPQMVEVEKTFNIADVEYTKYLLSFK